jgi:hypothetical protein
MRGYFTQKYDRWFTNPGDLHKNMKHEPQNSSPWTTKKLYSEAQGEDATGNKCGLKNMKDATEPLAAYWYSSQ